MAERAIHPFAVTAEVRVSEALDRLVIAPRRHEDAQRLRGLLKEEMRGIDVHRSAEGVWVSPNDAEALHQVKRLVELTWHPEALLFVENRRRANRVHADLHRQVDALRLGGRQAAVPMLEGSTDLDVLDDHQLVNVAAMTLPGGFGLCVFDEQGAGKTVTFIFAYDVLVARDEVDFALIVAPKSMVPEWPRDYERFMGDLYKVQVAAGSRRQKVAALRSRADVIVTNFETAIAMEDEIRALLRRYRGRAVLVVDESFYIKNLDAKRTRALRRLREYCGRAFVLCGTPAPNAPHDLIQQFSLVDFGLTFEGVDVPDDRALAQPVVQRAIEHRGLYIRHLKADVLPDLPAKRFHRVLLPLEPEQRRAYAAALQGLLLDLRSVDDQTFSRQLASFLARRAALLQICSNPTSILEGYTEVPAKLHALDTLLEQAITQQGEKVVVWSFYTASLDTIVSRFSRFSPVRYDGTIADVAVRREAVRRFQDDDETMLFVGNPAAAGAGLTLHRARLAVYESMSNQPAHYLQSLDRIHRRGQSREVEYLVLLCDKTLEIADFRRLTDKERASQALLKDQVDHPPTRSTMLAEATAAIKFLEGEEGPPAC